MPNQANVNTTHNPEIFNSHFHFPLFTFKQLDTYMRESPVGDKFVGLNEAELKISSSLGLGTLKFVLHMTQDSPYSTQRIENAFDNDLAGDGSFSGNRVVSSSFLVGK